MDLIDKNIETYNPKPDECEFLASQLDWEKIDSEDYLKSLPVTDSKKQIVGKFSDLKFDFIIGSDVIYWP